MLAARPSSSPVSLPNRSCRPEVVVSRHSLVSSRSVSALAVGLALAALVSEPASPAEAQRVVRPGRGGAVVVEPDRRGGGGRGGAVVVEPGRSDRRGGGGGAVVVEPDRRGGGAIVVHPGRPDRRGGGAVVVEPDRRGGAVVVEPDRRGGAVVVDPDRRSGGAVVIDPRGRGGAVVVDPRRDDRAGRRGGVVVVGPRGVVRSAPSRITVVAPPPPPRPRTRWAPPSRHGEVWIQPYWGWTGGSWEWIEGHWEQPPQRGAVWIDPRFESGGWIPGYWTTPQVSAPPTYGTPYRIGTQLAGAFSPSDARDSSGAAYHDYVIAMSAGETATILVVGGPSPQYPGQRIDVALQILANGMVVANGSSRSGLDAQVTITSPQPAIYVIRASSRSGGYGGTYLLQSAPGSWVPQSSPYDDYWGGGGAPQYYEQPGQAYPDCRRTVMELGHPPSSTVYCDGAEPYCSEALLRRGHPPSSLMFCQGVDPQCAVSLLESGRAPGELAYCR
jgi:hypothetical protein